MNIIKKLLASFLVLLTVMTIDSRVLADCVTSTDWKQILEENVVAKGEGAKPRAIFCVKVKDCKKDTKIAVWRTTNSSEESKIKVGEFSIEKNLTYFVNYEKDDATHLKLVLSSAADIEVVFRDIEYPKAEEAGKKKVFLIK